jgi:hypothetical protein
MGWNRNNLKAIPRPFAEVFVLKGMARRWAFLGLGLATHEDGASKKKTLP